MGPTVVVLALAAFVFVLTLFGCARVRKRVTLQPELEARVKNSAEAACAAMFPGREGKGSEVWAVEGDMIIVPVYQRHIRPPTAPMFFAVSPNDMSAELASDPLEYRPRDLK